MNPLLTRHIRAQLSGVDVSVEPWKSFLAAVSKSVDEFQTEHRVLSHTLEVRSAELTRATEQLRKDSENRLKNLSEYYQQTLELQQGMILCFHKTERGYEHTLCRGQLAERLGWSADETEGRLPEEIYPRGQLHAIERAYARAWRGTTCAFEAHTENGEIYFLCVLCPRREDGEVREVIVSGVEITALKHLEGDLRQAKENAEQADKSKSEFLAVMTHEIRTPLNAISGFAQLLRDSPLDEEQRQWLTTIAASTESLRTLIDDILDFSKIEAGMLELEESPVVLSELIESVSSMFRPRVSEKGLELHVRLAPKLPHVITTDGHRLRQILVNLVNNAVKFTEDGSISIEASVLETPTENNRREWQLRFDIRDTGVGIKPEHRDRLFKPFSQADSSTTRLFGGTGLGLAICKRLAHALGGEINFTSEVGKGSAFFFSIRAGERSSDAREPDVFSHSALSRLPRLRVLVVEDNPTNRALMRQILRRFGYEADFADNGREAVFTATDTEYDLIVMDLQMPEMDGYDAAREIRAGRNGRSQPRIIALTATTGSEQHQRCFDVGMDAVLTKPVKLEALFSELARTTPVHAV
jgi:signal transduction histidine kinase/ActR/RegA family two-component response regulator